MFTTEALHECTAMIINGDLRGLYFNPTFGMLFVASIPCGLGVYTAVHLFQRQSFLGSLCLFPIELRKTIDNFLIVMMYPLSFTPVHLAFMLGWYPLLISPKILELTLVSPAFWPWITYASRDIHSPGWGTSKLPSLLVVSLPEPLLANYLLVVHSPFMNRNWAVVEQTKHIALQCVDWFVFHYVLLFLVCLCLYMILGIYAFIIVRALLGYWIHGGNPVFLLTGKFMDMVNEKAILAFRPILGDKFIKEMDGDGERGITLAHIVAGWCMTIHFGLFHPCAHLMLVPALCLYYWYEVQSLMAPYYQLYSIPYTDTAAVDRVFLAVDYILHEDPEVSWYDFPIHHMISKHAEYMHEFWHLCGLM